MPEEENILEDVEENIEEGIESVEEVVGEILDVAKEKRKVDKKPSKKDLKEPVKRDRKMAKKTAPVDIIQNVSEELSGLELESAAEEESLATEKPEKSIEEKKKAVLEKAKKLAEKIEVTATEELKEKVKGKKKEDTLLPLEDYVKAGIYLGTKVVTPAMRPFVYRRRADGLAIFNTDIIDEKLKEGVAYLSKFAKEDVIIVCKRMAGWKAVEMFSKLTGIRAFTKKYPAGVLTNTKLPDFFEVELAIICDSWLDKNALHDMKKVNKKILMICDTNNFAKGADQIIIGNNKSPRSLGLILYLLAKGYCKANGIEAEIPELDWWTSEEGVIVEEKKVKIERNSFNRKRRY
ncbi:MAG: 30S ribosomal protein S2 [Nanoarchaeota archaeon]|nr:30S ribosomal protein S2 [Nanoarchaeota archaeon]